MGNAWTNHVKEYYYKVKETNPSYTFRQALSDAPPLSIAVNAVKNIGKKVKSVISDVSSKSSRGTQKRRRSRHSKTRGRTRK
jgi:hypothetical protein